MKVLILQSHISSYNIPVYKLLSTKVELTVAYTIANESQEHLPFKILKLDHINLCNFIIIKNKFRKICNTFDVVIFMADLHYLSFWALLLFRSKTKLIPWSVGIRASYKRLYSLSKKKGIIDILYGKLLNCGDSVLFYMHQPITFWKGIIDEKKIFVAHNTVDVLNFIPNQVNNKQNILFIGSLYKEKMIYELIDAYLLAKKKSNSKDFFTLTIVGGGTEFSKIDFFINENKLTKNIFLLGPIFEEEIVSELFLKSLLCVSPNQAGLSVLKSMGYGVPFVTRQNAITGGERLNIIDRYNGILYNSLDDLVNIISDAYINKNEYIKMGENAKEYYNSCATPYHMADGFIDAINFSLKQSNTFEFIKKYK